MPVTWASAPFWHCCQCCLAHKRMHAARLWCFFISHSCSTLASRGILKGHRDSSRHQGCPENAKAQCTRAGLLLSVQCVHPFKNLSSPGCRGCTSEDFWVVVTEGQCADCHDLRNSAEPEVFGVPDLLHVPQALWRMPACNIAVSFCTSSYNLSKDW